MRFRAFCLIAAGFLPLSGCVVAAVGAAGAAGVAAIQDKTMGESLDDANISNELKARLMTTDARAFNEVDVEVANKVALLSGRVPTMADRHEAERIAWEVALIETVANELQVREQGGVMQNLNDEWITTRVRSRLVTDGAIKSVNVNIETYDGTVYLMGIARSQAELQLIAEHASKVRGVKEVVSYIQIRNGQTTARAPSPAPAPAPAPTPGSAPEPFNPYAVSSDQELAGGPSN